MKITSHKIGSRRSTIKRAAAPLQGGADGIFVSADGLILQIVDRGRTWRVELNEAETALTAQRLRHARARIITTASA